MFLKDKFAFGVISTKVWDNNSISEIIILKLSQSEFTLVYHTLTLGRTCR